MIPVETTNQSVASHPIGTPQRCAHILLHAPTTPAFVYDEACMADTCRRVANLCCKADCQLLYALKPMNLRCVLEVIAHYVDGFAASSLFEARLARDVLGADGTVHITTPGFRARDMQVLSQICDYIAFNSLSQWGRFAAKMPLKTQRGLRVNPQLSLVEDDRYDPCRRYSKLGAPMDKLITCMGRHPELLDTLTGVHLHTNCDSRSFDPLLRTVERVEERLSDLLKRLTWVNLGGGYLIDDIADPEPFLDVVDILRDRYELNVFVEPGAALVRTAGYLVATVIDVFHSDGKTIAVLDTSVNHMPEVFEYQFTPDVFGQSADAPHHYVLAGCTCLAGDVFGEFAFAERLERGSRVLFVNVGAYTTTKWNWFNGVALPDVYGLTPKGELVSRLTFEYEVFATQHGAK